MNGQTMKLFIVLTCIIIPSVIADKYYCPVAVSIDDGTDSFKDIHTWQQAYRLKTKPSNVRVKIVPQFDDAGQFILKAHKNLDLLTLKNASLSSAMHDMGIPDIHCYYRGLVEGEKDSTAALSLCKHSISALISSRSSPQLYLSLRSIENNRFILVNHPDNINNSTENCAFIKSAIAEMNDNAAESNEHRRRKRTLGDRPSYYSEYVDYSRRRFIELYLVADESMWKKYGDAKCVERIFEVANYVAAIYDPLNIGVALVGYKIWKTNPMVVDSNSDNVLNQFLEYRKSTLLKEMPHDAAHLMTDVTFAHGTIGKAFVGSMCTYERSGGVDMDHMTHADGVASTIAHETGHLLGAEHDDDNSQCGAVVDRCIMFPMTSGLAPTVWSRRSLEYIKYSLENDKMRCLVNQPVRFADGPVCGNGFLEDGEECDCGVSEICETRCCNPKTCKLNANAVCGSGVCCNMDTCQYKTAGTICRSSVDECDLDEYCDGDTATCPDDTYKHDGLPCADNAAFCAYGRCGNRDTACAALWGPGAERSPDTCAQLNANSPSVIGNCGINMDESSSRSTKNNKFYLPCSQTDALCGRLHCTGGKEKTLYSSQATEEYSNYIMQSGDRRSICKVAVVKFGTSPILIGRTDPGLTPDGAVCGVDKMCRDTKCHSVKKIMYENECAYPDCSGNGYCNNKGECHCDSGYGGADCSGSGSGGSPSSGPASGYSPWLRILGYVLMIIVMGAVGFCAFKYCRNRSRYSKSKSTKINYCPDVTFRGFYESLRSFTNSPKPTPREQPRRPPPPKVNSPAIKHDTIITSNSGRNEPAINTIPPPNWTAKSTTHNTPNPSLVNSTASLGKPSAPVLPIMQTSTSSIRSKQITHPHLDSAPVHKIPEPVNQQNNIPPVDFRPIPSVGVAAKPTKPKPPRPTDSMVVEARLDAQEFEEVYQSTVLPPLAEEEIPATLQRNTVQRSSSSASRPGKAPPAPPAQSKPKLDHKAVDEEEDYDEVISARQVKTKKQNMPSYDKVPDLPDKSAKSNVFGAAAKPMASIKPSVPAKPKNASPASSTASLSSVKNKAKMFENR